MKKAETAHNNGNYKEAIAYYKRLIELSPDDVSLHWDLGVAYVDSKDLRSALKQIATMEEMGHSDMAQTLRDLMSRAKERP